jgi:NADH-quinone oxidoreductase subunit E
MPAITDLSLIEPVLQKHKGRQSDLIAILQEIQGTYSYLPEEALIHLSNNMRIPLSRIFAVATFYAQFRLKRPGEHVIKVCQGTACHVRGSPRVMDALVDKLDIHAGETTQDFKFSLESIACFGSCALAPVMVVDKNIYGRMTTAKARQILGEYKGVK